MTTAISAVAYAAALDNFPCSVCAPTPAPPAYAPDPCGHRRAVYAAAQEWADLVADPALEQLADRVDNARHALYLAACHVADRLACDIPAALDIDAVRDTAACLADGRPLPAYLYGRRLSASDAGAILAPLDRWQRAYLYSLAVTYLVGLADPQ